LSYVLALMAAFVFALGNVLQQKGTLETPSGERSASFVAQILRRPVWLAGAGLVSAGWILQAAALDRGSLIVVQSITTLSLVIALPLGARITNQQIDRRVWVGAGCTFGGIVLFLSAGLPQGGTSHPSSTAWWVAGLLSLGAVVALAIAGAKRAGANRALLLGAAAGVCYAMQAAVTKVFVTTLGRGPSVIFSSWSLYALVVTALIGFVLQQSALRTGVLAAAMASNNAVTLFVSVLLGITIFGEKLAKGGGNLAPAVLGLVAALVGVVLLAGAKPPESMTGDRPTEGQLPLRRSSS
jgi:drug/metabolite transporter (DMT)-like permease